MEKLGPVDGESSFSEPMRLCPTSPSAPVWKAKGLGNCDVILPENPKNGASPPYAQAARTSEGQFGARSLARGLSSLFVGLPLPPALRAGSGVGGEGDGLSQAPRRGAGRSGSLGAPRRVNEDAPPVSLPT